MKAKEGDRIRTVTDVESPFNHRTVPARPMGVIVDAPSKGQPEAYSADLGENGSYDHVELTPEQFVLAER